MKKKGKITVISITMFLAFIYINNSMLFTDSDDQQKPLFLAHRGLAQTFDISKVKWDTNTAAIIYKPEHEFIENTLSSIQASFDNGADVVELDIRVSKDKQLVVFHDSHVDYRTEKKGKVSDFTLKELQQMDIGYGYTHDNGKSYPLRSKDIGLMPSFDQVTKEFPQKEFLVHIRDNGPEIAHLLLGKFKTMKDEIKYFSVYGNDEATAIIKKEFPQMRTLTAKNLKKALIHYALIGWSGYVPESMHNMQLHLPVEYSKFLWGWPVKFHKRMNKVNSRVVLVQMKGPWSGGFDTVEDLKKIPDNYYGYIWTDRIDRVGDHF